jgi:hypothetical protein
MFFHFQPLEKKKVQDNSYFGEYQKCHNEQISATLLENDNRTTDFEAISVIKVSVNIKWIRKKTMITTK